MQTPRLILACATLALIGSIGMPAHAQSVGGTLRVQRPFRLKVGAFFPSSSDIRDAVGDVFFSYGVSYDFAKSRTSSPLVYSLYVDGATRSRSQDVEIEGATYDTDVRATYTGVGPSVRAYLTPAVGNVRAFAGLGIGAYFVNRRVAVNVGRLDVSESRNSTRFGGKVLAGVELGNGLLGEADYTYIGEVDDVNFGGFNLSLGYRF